MSSTEPCDASSSQVDDATVAFVREMQELAVGTRDVAVRRELRRAASEPPPSLVTGGNYTELVAEMKEIARVVQAWYEHEEEGEQVELEELHAVKARAQAVGQGLDALGERHRPHCGWAQS